MTIEEFVDNSEDFDMYEYKLKWNDYNVYEVWLKSCEYSCTGYPQYALEKDGEIRESTHEETIEIMRSLPYSDDED